MNDHKITVYAPGDAYDLLQPVYKDSAVVVKPIPGLCFSYNRKAKLDYVKTGLNSLGYFVKAPGLIDNLSREFDREQPDLIISDFEPILPRVARRCGVPFLSVDHQHFLNSYDLSSLPFMLRAKAGFMAQFVKLYYRGQAGTIVSSFYFPPLRDGMRHVKQVGVMLRDEIVSATPTQAEHITVYLRKNAPQNVLSALAEIHSEVRIYGLGSRPAMNNLRFFNIDMFQFVEDLASCRALITSAGNQLIGEALYLGKPVLAMPETGNFEQQINAHFLAQSGAGVSVEMTDLNANILNRFLSQADVYRSHIDASRMHGNPETLNVIRSFLEQTGKHALSATQPLVASLRTVS